MVQIRGEEEGKQRFIKFQGKGPASSGTPPPKRSKKKKGGSFSPFHDELSQTRYKTIFSSRGLLIEKPVALDALHTIQLYEHINTRGWMPIMSIKGLVHDEAVRIFNSNIFDENFWTLSFYSLVYKIPILINPDYISTFWGIPRVADVIPFPPKHMSKEDKAAMTRRLCGKTIRWTTKLAKSDCIFHSPVSFPDFYIYPASDYT